MADNPYVNKVVLGNQTIMDLTQDSVEPSNLLEGKTAHSRSGEPITGTAKQGHVIKDQDGTSMTQRGNLKFKGGFKVSDDSQNNTTEVQKDIPITWSAWNALTEQEAEGKDYFITDEPYVNGQSSADVFTKLWENPSPTSAFAAQNITLASDDYDFLLVETTTSAGSSSLIQSDIAEKGKDIFCNIAVGNGNQVRSRQIVYTNSTTLAVGDAYRSGAVDNSTVIPIVIYGIKKTINFDFTAVVANVSTDASKCMVDENTSVKSALQGLATNDLLGSLTVPSVAGWASFSVSDLSKYNFISITVMTSDDGSYPVFISMADLVNINATNALVIYGTANTDRVMIAYTDSTHLGIYNSHTACTIVVRGFM